jgi:DNA-binding LacI/PurR family transcriptional regulator
MPRHGHWQKESVRLRSLAAAAGVSIATVSRTINGTAYVSPDLKRRVLQAIEDLDYIQNIHAGPLRPVCRKLLGLMISEPIQSSFPHLIHHFEDAAFLRGYAVLIGTVSAASRGTDVLMRQMIEQKVDGVAILTNSLDQDLVDLFLRNDIRLFCLTPHQGQPGVDVLGPDMKDAANHAVQHLAVLGHRSIAFVAAQQEDAFMEMPSSFFSLAMSKIGIQVRHESIVKDTGDGGEDLQVVQELLEHSAPTAIICASDLLALKTLRAASSMGFNVPADLSVVGYGDVCQAHYSNPPLTTIQLSQSDLAAQAVDRLCRPQPPNEPYPIRARGIDLNLLVRQSTSFPRHSRLKRKTRSIPTEA